ncbi:MAG: chemotaxis protein CheY [Geobacteraceae bacterium]|nr:chemotaxis protein CheY [Geobacteraceae bacterium]
MTALIVGGDYIEPIEKIINDRGVRKIEHWTGRKAGDLKKIVPKDTRLVVLLCDYLNHGLAKKVRGDANRLGLPVIYCRRSLGQFCEKLDEVLENGCFVLGGKAPETCCDDCPLTRKVNK